MAPRSSSSWSTGSTPGSPPIPCCCRCILIQYWGGPTTYSDTRGHPRLRMRHVPSPIGEAERDAWLRCMADAVTGAEDLHPELAARFMDYFVMAAGHLVNSP